MLRTRQSISGGQLASALHMGCGKWHVHCNLNDLVIPLVSTRACVPVIRALLLKARLREHAQERLAQES